MFDPIISLVSGLLAIFFFMGFVGYAKGKKIFGSVFCLGLAITFFIMAFAYDPDALRHSNEVIYRSRM
jgi:amino acid transporter